MDAIDALNFCCLLLFGNIFKSTRITFQQITFNILTNWAVCVYEERMNFESVAFCGVQCPIWERETFCSCSLIKSRPWMRWENPILIVHSVCVSPYLNSPKTTKTTLCESEQRISINVLHACSAIYVVFCVYFVENWLTCFKKNFGILWREWTFDANNRRNHFRTRKKKRKKRATIDEWLVELNTFTKKIVLVSLKSARPFKS